LVAGYPLPALLGKGRGWQSIFSSSDALGSLQRRWQEAPNNVPLVGTVVQLIIRSTLSELLTSFCFLVIAAGGIQLSRPADVLIPLLLPSVAALFWTGFFWLDIHRAERYFKQALLLTKV
jgi:hypothetical protein